MFSLRSKSIVTALSLGFLSATSVFAQNARIQVVHNSPNAPAVDIFVNAAKLLPNVPFRAASPFINAPAGVPLQIRIKPASSSPDTSSPVFFRTYTLEAGQGYYLVASGNLPGGTNAPNPDGIGTGFDITVIPGAKETSSNSTQTELRIFHGVTDAPTVDIKAQGVGTLADNVPFRAASPYIPVAATSYTVQIAPAAGTPNLLAYSAPLSGLAGSTALVLASGYFTPSANPVGGNPGPGFGIWAFTPAGQAIQLPTATSRVQIVHNSASAPAVDVFVNGAKAVPALEFRKATPFVTLNAGVPLVVALKGASASNDTSNPAFRRTYELAGGESYSLVATGLLSTQTFAANPDNINRDFDITVMPGAREISSTASTSDNAEIRVLHAVTDAPTVDVRVQGGATLVDNAPFRAFTPYLSAPNTNLVVEVTDAGQTVVVEDFLAPLSAFPDSAILVAASGFLTPASNLISGNPGPGFGLLAILPSGATVLLPVVTRIPGTSSARPIELFPNPSQSDVRFRIPSGTEVVSVEAINSLGQKFALRPEMQNASLKVSLPAARGIYTLSILTSNGTRFTGKVARN